MKDMAEIYEKVLMSSKAQREKIEILLASMICNEVLDKNCCHSDDLMDLCSQNVQVLNNSLNHNIELLNALENTESKEGLCNLIVEFLKSRDELIEQIDKSKKMFGDIKERAFTSELKHVIERRKII